MELYNTAELVFSRSVQVTKLPESISQAENAGSIPVTRSRLAKHSGSSNLVVLLVSLAANHPHPEVLGSVTTNPTHSILVDKQAVLSIRIRRVIVIDGVPTSGLAETPRRMTSRHRLTATARMGRPCWPCP